jgi:hypothetical protein
MWSIYVERRAVGELQDIGAEVFFDTNHSSGYMYVSHVRCPANRIDEAMKHLSKLRDLDCLEIIGEPTAKQLDKVDAMRIPAVRFRHEVDRE